MVGEQTYLGWPDEIKAWGRNVPAWDRLAGSGANPVAAKANREPTGWTCHHARDRHV